MDTKFSVERSPSTESSESPTQVSQKQVNFEFFKNCKPFGTIQRTSLNGVDIRHDWALIELDSSVAVISNTVPEELYPDNDGKRSLSIKKVVKTGPAERKVLAVTGFNGVLPGMMSKIPTFMMLPTNSSFEEVWTVNIEYGSIGE